ncbi:MAG: adenylosuccinate lyase, partial [Methanomicrobiales archaeon]|nr:adenylosuccinate lyase [Methanomicrobiales archaeon]
KQVGSSTMPHKRNPVKSEQVSGLARVIRAAIEPALQNNTLWDERDLTNSSVERVILPEVSILTDHVLGVMIRVLSGLTINKKNVRKNLELLHGINMAEAVMIELTRRGMSRQDAHERVRIASMQAFEEGRHLADVLVTDHAIAAHCTRDELVTLLDPDQYIGTAVQQVEAVIRKLSPLCT